MRINLCAWPVFIHIMLTLCPSQIVGVSKSVDTQSVGSFYGRPERTILENLIIHDPLFLQDPLSILSMLPVMRRPWPTPSALAPAEVVVRVLKARSSCAVATLFLAPSI